MSPEKEQKILNPKIETIQIGVRSLREIKIFPLSMADQMEMSDLITKGLQAFFGGTDFTDIAFVELILNLLKENINKILNLITDEEDRPEDSFLKEMTNDQAVELAEKNYRMN